MIFDVACRVVEKLPNMFPWVKRAMRKGVLFDFPWNAHEVLPREYDADQVYWLWENFFLPFPEIIIEDPASLILLVDTEENAVGVDKMRAFMEVISTTPPDGAFDGPKMKEVPDEIRGMYCVTTGVIRLTDVTKVNWEIEGRLAKIWFVDKDGEGSEIPLDMGAEMKDAFMASAFRNVTTALQEVMLINAPDRFIVETTPKKVRKMNSPLIPRLHERPRYTILRPKEIQKLMGVPEESGKVRAAHPRRQHLRKLRSDKFVNAKGKNIIVKATWIGPTEAKVDGKRYKVLLDK